MTEKDMLTCLLCGEDFPLNEDEKARIAMGVLYPARRFKDEQIRVLDGDGRGQYLCGNCYFDMKDDEEDTEK